MTYATTLKADIVNNPNDPAYVSDAIVVTVKQPLRDADLKRVCDAVQANGESGCWVGTEKFKVAFVWPIPGLKSMKAGYMKLQLPRDNDAMTELLLSIPELGSVKFSRNYDIRKTMLGASVKPINRVKKEVKKEVVLNRWGHDESKINPRLLHLYEHQSFVQGVAFAKALVPYPFKEKTLKENQTYIEMDIIQRLRAKFPAIYEADRVLEGRITKALRLIAEPDNQQFLPRYWRKAFGMAFIPGSHPGALHSATGLIIDHFAIRSKLGKEKFLKAWGKRLDTEDEAMDPLIKRYTSGSGAVRDRDVSDVEAEAEDTFC